LHGRLRSAARNRNRGIRVKSVILVLGILALVAGLFWAGLGAGFIKWPTPQPGQFTMVGHSNWVFIGLGVAIAGLGLVLLARRRA